MADDEHQEIGAALALALLAVEDPAVADDAQTALEWIAGDHRLELVTQHRVQDSLPDFRCAVTRMIWLSIIVRPVSPAGSCCGSAC
jgi:hypothetical protein